MSESTLQDRLRDHAKAFDGLLSLIPATKYYPPEDTTNQWKKKKQTKQEAAAARRGKLDPDSQLNRNAKEVMDERASSKRKLREMQQNEPEVDPEAKDVDENTAGMGIETERPGHGLKKKVDKSNKRPKSDRDDEIGVELTPQSARESRREQKKATKKTKKAEKKAQLKECDSPTQNSLDDNQELKPVPVIDKKRKDAKSHGSRAPAKPQNTRTRTETKEQQNKTENPLGDSKSTNGADISNLEEHGAASASESDPLSPTFDGSESAASPKHGTELAASTNTSVSSTVPPSDKPKHLKIPVDTTALRARLAAKIEALRAARKADGPDGKPIRTRQELIEARRAKEAQRKAHKKELRRQAKLEEARKHEEELASNSPGMMSPSVDLDEPAGNISFGRVVFGDGSQMSHDLSYVLNQGKKKGPSDAKTALLKVQNQKKRLQDLDAEKQADIAEKEVWLTARRRAEGDKIRDDEALLKKAVKRKDAAKKKSEKTWKDRVQGVEHAQKERQKKREQNINKRREDKMLGKAGKKKGGSKAKRARPGFEGRLDVPSRRK